MGVNEETVEEVLDKDELQAVPLHYYCTFDGGSLMPLPQTEMLLEQKKVIEAIAKKGRNFVIVGRNADAILSKYKPFNIFFCADMDAKIKRCMEHRTDDEPKTVKEMEKKIIQVDKKRALTRNLITGSKYGDKYEYHAVINTTKWDKDALVKGVIQLINSWYGERE